MPFPLASMHHAAVGYTFSKPVQELAAPFFCLRA